MDATVPAGGGRERGATASLFFVGTATVVLRCAGFTVLTDPNFLHAGQRAWLGWGLTSRRLTEPAISVDELPDLDLVVLSHLHGDHFDRVARRGLDHDVPVLTTPHAARRLRRAGFAAASGLATWQAHVLRRGTATLTVTAVPGRHAPGAAQLLLPPVMGSVLEFAQDGALLLRLYLSGDTLVVEGLREIGRRFDDDLDVGVLHLGGTTLPGGLVVTMDGAAGADLVELLRPRLVVPVHTDDYPVFRSPVEDFTGELDRRGIDTAVALVARGQTLPLAVRDRPGRAAG